MINRRRFLVGLGGISVGTTTVVGSSAISSSEVNRRVSIRIQDDDRAYLRLYELDEDFAYSTGDRLDFRFDDDFRSQTNTEDQGGGVGTDSVYEFVRLFGVGNQGTKPVQVFGIYKDNAMNDVQLLEYAPNKCEDQLTETSRSSWIDPGNSIHLTMILDTRSVDLDDYSTTITIAAAAADSHVFP